MKDGATALQNKTTALEQSLEFLRDAFVTQPEIFTTLCHIIDASLVARYPLAIGTILSFISSPNTVCLFRGWADHCPEASALAAVGEALSDLQLPSHLIPLATSKRGREHFYGGLNDYYLLALLAERIPAQSADVYRWMHELRVWLFVHAFSRSRRGIRLDENLQTIARSMRMACDDDPEWFRLFMRLQQNRPSRSFLELNFHINARARQLLSLPELRDKERKTLKAISEIAFNRDKQLKNNSPVPDLIGKPRVDVVVVESSIDTDDRDEHPSTILFDGDQGATLISKPLPEGYTPAQRKLSTRTVLLANVESTQLLPWSWQKPNPTETTLLHQWIDSTLASAPSASSDALAAAYLWSGITLGRSSTRMLALGINTAAGLEWQFDPKHGIFNRQPPMRRPGWLPDSDAQSWIRPTATEITVSPPDTVRLALQTACRRSPGAVTFRELWPAGAATTPEQAIRTVLKSISNRLTGTMLQEILPQSAFRQHQDAVLARLIASHPQTPLSGAYSYAQWSLDTVTRLLSGNKTQPPRDGEQTIGLGSRLAVLDDLIRNALSASRKAVGNARKTGDAVQFHNTYTAYVVIALLAATGARPIRSPFESLDFFDLEAKLVFIDDKRGGAQQRAGRVLPLVSGIAAFLEKRYLPHLRALAGQLGRFSPALSQNIFRIANRTARGELPFFFFLDGKGGWTEITPTSLFRHAHLNWPLPANLFRHRLPNRLRSLGVDPEIIDGLMGHGEWGSETWNHLSFRTWQDDAAAARPALEKAFKALRFHPLRGLEDATSQSPEASSPDIASLEPIRLFGAEARDHERRRRYLATLRGAEFTIRDYLQGRELGTLSSDELDDLADKLTRTPEGMPIPSGGLRLALLIRKIERVESRTGKRHRPKKERLLVNDPPSMFSENAPRATAYERRAAKALDGIAPKTPATKRIASVFALCVESRITDISLLMDVLNGRNYRLVRIGSRFYLEHGQVTDNSDVAGQRFGVTAQTARWLHGSAEVRRIDPRRQLPTSLRIPVPDLPATQNTLKSVLSAIAEMIEQSNALALPGIVSGVLSGKLESTALGWRDAVRLQTGRKIRLEISHEGVEAETPLKYRGTFIQSATPYQRNEANQELIKKVRSALREADQASPGTPNVRRSMRAALEGAIREGIKQCASPALLLLAEWLLHQARPEHRDVPKPGSLLRYWTSLAERFRAELCESDLLHADDEELTEAYTRVLISNGRKAGYYDLERLAHFHRWLSRTFDVENPTWEELPLVSPGLGVAPGFITQEEYLIAFDRLLNTQAQDAETSVGAAMTLLLAYRFGMRRNEALYLSREDWDDRATPTVVTVRGNRWRRLKSPASQRQVPLLFSLTAVEQETVTRALVLYATRHGTDHSHQLLHITSPEQTVEHIRQELKQATGNSETTLHHARHSAANLVALLATGRFSVGSFWPSPANEPSLTCLTGSPRVSRRHAWAISRFLGHASPRTSCRSYLHFVYDWADCLIGLPDISQNEATLQGVLQVDQMPESETDTADGDKNIVSAPQASLETILKAFRLHARQVSAGAIAFSLGLQENTVQYWLSLLNNGDEITRAGEIVEGLSESTWDRLIAWSGSIVTNRAAFSSGLQLTPSELVEMVGEKRQLLGWRAEHFAIVRFTLDSLRIPDTEYSVFGSARLHDGTLALAAVQGFSVSERPVSKPHSTTKERPRKIQIDSAFCGRYREPVASRIAFLFEENDTHAIRNRHQFALVVLMLGLLTNQR